MAKSTKKKKVKYTGELDEKTGKIKWSSPSKAVTTATEPPPPPPKLPG